MLALLGGAGDFVDGPHLGRVGLHALVADEHPAQDLTRLHVRGSRHVGPGEQAQQDDERSEGHFVLSFGSLTTSLYRQPRSTLLCRGTSVCCTRSTSHRPRSMSRCTRSTLRRPESMFLWMRSMSRRTRPT